MQQGKTGLILPSGATSRRRFLKSSAAAATLGASRLSLGGAGRAFG